MAELDTGTSGGGGDGGDDGFWDSVADWFGSGDDVTMTPEEQNEAALDLAGLSDEQNDVLSTFSTSPVGFVLGIILEEILGGIEAITTVLVEALTVVFVGSQPGTQGTLGIADMPLYVGELVAGILRPTASGGSLGDAVVSTVAIPFGIVVDLAGQAGPLEPVVLAGGAAAGIIGVAWVLRQLLVLATDAIPGAGVLLP